ncbi:MAG: RNA-binding S4 domain-containing protein [Bacteroidia bacterium]|nr:RNA-binding S4 domain-containing protein [Bacteroidia bacterium]
MSEIRIDKWLWAVRIFKSRSMATEACRKGKITIDGQELKASHIVKMNEIIGVRQPPIIRTYRVKGLIENRVSAKIAIEYKEETTAPEELAKLEISKLESAFYRPGGQGRPTKKDRRELDKLTEDLKI